MTRIESVILELTIPFDVEFLFFSFAWFSKLIGLVRNIAGIKIIASISYLISHIISTGIISMVPPHGLSQSSSGRYGKVNGT